jgi:hypothetical protein
MKRTIKIFIPLLVMFLWGCNSSTTPTDEDKAYLLDYGTKYQYEFGVCDQNWNLGKDTNIVIMTFTDRKYYPEASFNIFSMSNYEISGGAAFLSNSFWTLSAVGQPFIDTNFVGSKMYGYSYLNPVKFNPFSEEAQKGVKRDTVYEDLYLYQYLTPNPVLFPSMIVQEWSSKILSDTTILVLGENQKCKRALLYINRFIRPKYSWKKVQYTRPSADSSLNEFYFDGDDAVYLDKIQMTILYKPNLGFAEILILHRSVWGDKYYKWKLKVIKK